MIDRIYRPRSNIDAVNWGGTASWAHTASLSAVTKIQASATSRGTARRSTAVEEFSWGQIWLRAKSVTKKAKTMSLYQLGKTCLLCQMKHFQFIGNCAVCFYQMGHNKLFHVNDGVNETFQGIALCAPVHLHVFMFEMMLRLHVFGICFLCSTKQNSAFMAIFHKESFRSRWWCVSHFYGVLSASQKN